MHAIIVLDTVVLPVAVATAAWCVRATVTTAAWCVRTWFPCWLR